MLGQTAVDQKTNEIDAFASLLKGNQPTLAP